MLIYFGPQCGKYQSTVNIRRIIAHYYEIGGGKIDRCQPQNTGRDPL